VLSGDRSQLDRSQRLIDCRAIPWTARIRASVTLLAVLLLDTSACRGTEPAPREDSPASPETSMSAADATKELDGIQPGEEREVSDGVFLKMHRMQATEPIGDGWHRARSTEGGFSVELPLPFNDLRTRSKMKDGVDSQNHTVGAKTPGQLAWSATCIVRADGRPGPDGRPAGGDETQAKGTPVRAHTRTLALKDRTCVLTVEAQGSDPLPNEADRRRFLESFKRTAK